MSSASAASASSASAREMISSLLLDRGDVASSADTKARAAELVSRALRGGTLPQALSAVKEEVASAEATLKEAVGSEDAVSSSLIPLARSVSNDAAAALSALQTGVGGLRRQHERLRSEIGEPRREAEAMGRQLENLQDAVGLLRAAARYVRLVGKLRDNVKSARHAAASVATAVDGAGKGEGSGAISEGGSGGLSNAELPKIAKTLFEIGSVESADERMKEMRVVRAEQAYINEIRRTVQLASRSSLLAGLRSMSQSDVASALQVYYNLGDLNGIVSDIVEDAKRNVRDLLARAFDHNTIFGQEAHSMGFIASGNESAEKRQAALWRRIASSLDDVTLEIFKLWHLQRVVWKKRDPITHARFVDELQILEGEGDGDGDGRESAGLGDGALSFRLWLALTECIAGHFDGGNADPSSISSSSGNKQQQKLALMVRETLINGFPRLATMLELFLRKVKGETTVKSAPPSVPPLCHQQLLATVSPLEQQYLARTLSKLSDMVMAVLPGSTGGGTNAFTGGGGGKTVSLGDVSRLGKVMREELVELSGCPSLMNKQCQGIAKVVRLFAERCEYSSVTGPDSTHIQTSTGQSATTTATNAQLRNIALTNALQELYSKLSPLIVSLKSSGLASASATRALASALASLRTTARTVIEPLMDALLARLETIISSVHSESFESGDALSVVGGHQQSSATVIRQSMFATRLINAMQHTRSEYLSRMVPSPFSEDVDTGECSIASELSTSMAMRAVEVYCRNLSLLPRMSDDRRAKLAADMTNIESAMSKYLVPVELTGIRCHTLRTLRPLLFIANSDIDSDGGDDGDGGSSGGLLDIRSSPLLKQDILPTVVLYHLLMWRCPEDVIPPHVNMKMTQKQFCRWMDEHVEREIWQAVVASLDAYASGRKDREETETKKQEPRTSIEAEKFCQVLKALGDDLLREFKDDDGAKK